MIVGVIDISVLPDSVSFKDDRMTEIPARWKRICEEGQYFNSFMCNKKLIGGKYFNKRVKAVNPNITLSMNSGRYITGNGTHISSTVVGNYVDDSSFFGYALGTTRGIAPCARVAMYKVIWSEGRYASDVLAGIDQAVANGIDVISISMGFDGTPLYQDSIAVVSFGTIEKGVVFSSLGGNKGLIGILHNEISWVLTVSVGSMDRFFSRTLTLGNGLIVTRLMTFPAPTPVSNLPLIYNKTFSSCNSIRALSKDGNRIVICENENVSYQSFYLSQTNVATTIFISDDPQTLKSTDFSFPAVVTSSNDELSVIDYATKGMMSFASIMFQQMTFGNKPAPVVSSYTSRDPSSSYPGILKPDIVAPGTLILASWIPNDQTAFIDNDITLTSSFVAISGTSIACPRASGIVALLKGAYREWSPAAIRSAMMTTMNPFDNAQDYIRDSFFNYKIDAPLAMGTGQVEPNQALDPGLIYDAILQDYIDIFCSMNFTQSQIFTITRSSYNCFSPSSDLNYPSFIVFYTNEITSALVQKFQRTITNIGYDATSYKVQMTPPKSSFVTVEPNILEFSHKYEKQSYSLTI